MTARTIGEHRNVFYVPESVYGTTPTSALTWGGTLLSVKPVRRPKKEFIPGPGSRSFDWANKGAVEYGANVKYHARAVSGGYDWRNLAAVYAYGSTTGVAEHLGSFSMQISDKVASSYFYNLYNGCKIDKLTIQSEGAGMPLIFDADIIAQYITSSTAKAITGLQALTVGADPAEIASAVLRYTGNVQINIAGGGLVNLKPDSFKFSVSNGLQGQEGNLPGNSGGPYSLAAGNGINEGERVIEFEFSKDFEDETFHNAKLNDLAITALTIPVGANTVTLSNGEFIADDLAERLANAMFKESTKMRFKSLSIA